MISGHAVGIPFCRYMDEFLFDRMKMGIQEWLEERSISCITATENTFLPRTHNKPMSEMAALIFIFENENHAFEFKMAWL